jgi:ribosomal protein L16 Arg81 hydroxylase
MLSGSRRYILAHPKECSNLALYPQSHPSARHSSLTWDDSQDIPAHVHEVVLQAGDVLYLPPHWFHMIVSLDMNIQCNIRSGYNSKYAHYIRECGQTP